MVVSSTPQLGHETWYYAQIVYIDVNHNDNISDTVSHNGNKYPRSHILKHVKRYFVRKMIKNYMVN